MPRFEGMKESNNIVCDMTSVYILYMVLETFKSMSRFDEARWNTDIKANSRYDFIYVVYGLSEII